MCHKYLQGICRSYREGFVPENRRTETELLKYGKKRY